MAGQKAYNGRPRVGLVLSGGGAKGFAHVGVLKVIEEAGLTVDYIGGTSMGAIVGGLYAIGYDASALEALATSQNWDKLISDGIPREDLSIEEKEDADRFFVSFPLREKGIQLPAGVIKGQNVENLFSKLCVNAYKVRDFDDFPIPYLSVAADIVTGEEVVIRHGYLPDAMRASMAIPTIFTPVLYEGRLLVDGGLVNNFPVSNVKDMGADIVIGVDVGKSYYTREEITDLFKVLEQSIFMYGKENIDKNRKLCDILIEPDLKGYGIRSFNNADTLIARGYQAALRFLPQLKALADSLNAISMATPGRPPFNPVDTIIIKDISISGAEHVSEKLINGKLRLEEHKKVTPADLYESVSQAYTSLYFDKISYELKPAGNDLPGNEAGILIHVEEKKGGQLKVGLNYNSVYKASLALNATFRNILLDGSKLSLTANLGENPVIDLSYFKNNGWKPGFGIEFLSRDFNVNLFEDNSISANLDYTDFVTSLTTRSIINNSYSFGFGLEYEHILLDKVFGPTEMLVSTIYNFYNVTGFIDLDTYDHLFYPTRGSKLIGTYKFINSTDAAPFHFLAVRFENAASLGKRLVLKPGIHGGFTTADSLFSVYHFYLGGLNNADRKGLMPFTGLDFMQRSDRNVAVLKLDVQYNVWKNGYIILRTNIGNTTWTLAEQVFNPDIFFGAGLTFGYKSLIGPVEVTWMSSNLNRDLLFYLHIGYWF